MTLPDATIVAGGALDQLPQRGDMRAPVGCELGNGIVRNQVAQNPVHPDAVKSQRRDLGQHGGGVGLVGVCRLVGTVIVPLRLVTESGKGPAPDARKRRAHYRTSAG
jgi:hypothetical protein